MPKLQWTSLALEDLAEIKAYIRKDRPMAAESQAKKIKASVERLKRFPKSGRKLQTIPNMREVISGNYRIFYQVKKDAVEILRIYHGKQIRVDIL